MYIYIHAQNFSYVFLNPGRVAGGQDTALDHRSQCFSFLMITNTTDPWVLFHTVSDYLT